MGRFLCHRTGLPAELTAESISIINLKFGAKDKSVKWVKFLAQFFKLLWIMQVRNLFRNSVNYVLCFREMTFMPKIVFLINKVIKDIHIDYLTSSVNVLHLPYIHFTFLHFYLKAIHFVNSVCTIFSLWKQDRSHQTFPS